MSETSLKRNRPADEASPPNLLKSIAGVASEAKPSTGSLDEHLAELAKAIKAESAEERAGLVRALVGSALVFPHRLNAYMTVLGLLGEEGERIVRLALEEFAALPPIFAAHLARFVAEVERFGLIEAVALECNLPYVTAAIPGQEHHLAFEEHLAGTKRATLPSDLVDAVNVATRNATWSFDSFDAYWATLILSVIGEMNPRQAAGILSIAVPAGPLAEALFSLLFSSDDVLVIETAIVHCCRLDPRGFPPAMAKCVRRLAASAAISDAQRIVLARFFAFHLSNFEFRWSWDEWTPAATEALSKSASPLSRFVDLLMDALGRLSYGDRLRAALPAGPWHELIAKHRHEVEREAFAYSDTPITLSSGQSVPWTAVLAAVKGAPDSPPIEQIPTDALVQTMLFAGCKTVSHTMAVLDRYAASFLSQRNPAEVLGAVLAFHSGAFTLPCELTVQRLADLGLLTSELVKARVAEMLAAQPLLIPPQILLRRQ